MYDGLSIMTSFLAVFVHTDNGVTCSDSGFMDLSTAQECSGTVSYAKSFNSEATYRGDVHKRSVPKGCYIADWGSIHFNTHNARGSSSLYTSICRKGNT